MYKAVKLDASRGVVDFLDGTFTNARECFQAARAAFGSNGGIQFLQSKAVMK